MKKWKYEVKNLSVQLRELINESNSDYSDCVKILEKAVEICEYIKTILSEKDKRWNKFIEGVCIRNLSSLSKIQRKAVICLNYDAEMNNGGFSLYRDCYPDINSTELKEALIEISNEDIANNYM